MHQLESYNVVWESQSRHSGESMPVGGHDIGLNVWVEDSDLLFYIDRSGSFDENNQMLKIGRVRLRLDPNPFAGGAFRQELKLREGYLEVTGTLDDGLHARVQLWVDVFRPVIHIEVDSNRSIRSEIRYESWRLAAREIPFDRRMSSTSAVGYPGSVTTKPDQVQFSGDDIIFYHRNRSDELFFDKVVELEGLAAHKDQLWNPQIDTTFGGLMRGDAMRAAGAETGVYIQTPYTAWTLASAQPTHQQHAAIYLHTAQTPTIASWLTQLHEHVRAAAHDRAGARVATQQWWAAFWQRSAIVIDPDTKLADRQPWQVGRNYALFRYMLGCNAYGEYPTKFNGGLFTSDPCFVIDDGTWESESADFRRWGGGSFTAQNQRLVYWPLLKSGDFDMMTPQFEFYRRALANAELRTRAYWGHAGCSFTEQLENFGLPIGWAWGWPDSPDTIHRRTPLLDRTEQVAPWIKYYYTTQLEFAAMIMKYQVYSGNDIAAYLPFIESAIRFFDEHYQYMYALETTQKLDENGKLVIFPSTACETYKLAMNPTDALAALDATVRAVLDLPEHYLDAERRAYYRELLQRIPPLPFREKDGKTVLAPAEHWKGIINVEIPQLYPVFPYEQYGIGRKDLQIAIDTWLHGTDIPAQKNHISWHQDAIFCARLGLTDEAAAMTIRKLADGACRFPAFWGPGHDWLPDHNWGGSGMIGLQEMLMQTNGASIYLLPAWPRTWDVVFKLHAPYATLVEGRVAGGQLTELRVTPEQRRADLINLWEETSNS